MDEPKFRVTEIFHSIQGEANTVGRPTVFIRLTGCPLRCTYCDTEYAFNGGKRQSLQQILQQVMGFDCGYVTVTGGEPLAQPDCRTLLGALAATGRDVSLETSGALPIDHIDRRVSIVLDLKTPGSMESDKNLWQNVGLLKREDQVKFVICDEIDYAWSKSKTIEYNLTEKVEHIFFSPVHGKQDATQLAEWILTDQLNVRMQLQQHKLLWGDVAGK
jgi:7-carboxy-7-deazaguanine synthase